MQSKYVKSGQICTCTYRTIKKVLIRGYTLVSVSITLDKSIIISQFVS